MAKSYTITEAADYLGIQESDVEDLIASGEISFEIVEDEYRIPEDLLLKIRMEKRKERAPSTVPAQTLLDDVAFLEYLEDFVSVKVNEIARKIDATSQMQAAEMGNLRKSLTKRLDSYKEPLQALADLDSVMKSAVEKSFKDLKIDRLLPGKGADTGMLKLMKASVEEVLAESLKKQDDVLKAVKSLEGRFTLAEEKIVKALERLWKAGSPQEMKSRLDSFSAFLKEQVAEPIAELKEEMAELRKGRGKLEALKPGSPGEIPDPSRLMEVLAELSEGQKRSRKLIFEMNVSLKKSFLDRMEDFEQITREMPRILEDIKEVSPSLRELTTGRMEQLEHISRAVDALKKTIDLEGQGAIIKKLDEIRMALELNSGGTQGGGFSIPHMEQKFEDLRGSLQQLLQDNLSGQTGALSEVVGRIAFPVESVDSLNGQIQRMKTSISEFSDSLDRKFKQMGSVVDVLKTLAPGTLMTVGPIFSNERMERIQDSIDKLHKKMDEAMLGGFGRAVEKLLKDLRESQDSFQKVVVNMNMSNQKTLVEKMQLLDRLNELVLIRDNVDEISEQLQTFEAVTADINQLVDERLGVLAGIHEQMERLGAGGTGGGAGVNAEALLGEIRASMDEFHQQFAVDGFLQQMKTFVEDRIETLRTSQELTRETLSGLVDGSRDMLRQGLEDGGQRQKDAREAQERLESLEESAVQIFDQYDVRIESLEEILGRLEHLSGDQEVSESLAQVQRIIETEAGSLRSSLESARKVVMELGVSNSRHLSNKLEGTSLPRETMEELAVRNRQILQSLIGDVAPGQTLAAMIGSIRTTLDSLRESLNMESLLSRLDGETPVNRGGGNGEVLAALNSLHQAINKDMADRIDEIYEGVAQVLENIDVESITSAIGEAMAESSEAIQSGVRDVMEGQREELLQRIQGRDIPVLTSGETDLNAPYLEKMLEDHVSRFRNDLEGVQAALSEMNLDLQKQLISSLQEILDGREPGSLQLDSEALAASLDGMLEEKISEIRDTQETLLSINLNIQKALREKLSRADGQEGEGEAPQSLSTGAESGLEEKITRLGQSYDEARQAMEELSRSNHEGLMEKLEGITVEISRTLETLDVEKHLPALQEASALTRQYMAGFREDLESLRENLKMQDPQHLGSRFDEIRELLKSPALPSEAIDSIRESLQSRMEEHKENISQLGKKIQVVYDILKDLHQKQTGPEITKIHRMFSSKIDETRELERHLAQSFRQFQQQMGREQPRGGSEESGFMKEILESIEESRRDQEELSRKLDALSDLVLEIPSRKTMPMADEEPKAPVLPDPHPLIMENEDLKKSLEKLQDTNKILQKQLRSIQLVDGSSMSSDQVKSIMIEKDNLLEECYREKVEMREALDNERKDKYELVQRYETEKKELIDSLAMERIQREKERAELELLRAESRKRKWW